jgi:hypothetical protein
MVRRTDEGRRGALQNYVVSVEPLLLAPEEGAKETDLAVTVAVDYRRARLLNGVGNQSPPRRKQVRRAVPIRARGLMRGTRGRWPEREARIENDARHCDLANT